MVRHLLLVLAITLAGLGGASAERRLALVVGNNAYPALGPERQLRNAINDADAVAGALRRLDFEVITGQNLDRNAFIDKLTDLAARLRPGDTAFFYFAGHGVSLNGSNLLLPSDTPLPRAAGRAEEGRLSEQSIRETAILEQLKASGASVVMLVLDACRDNPLAASSTRSLGATRGLAVTPPPRGVVTLYSAGAGEAALDRLGDDDPVGNSVFTRVLVEKMTKPGLSVGNLARAVRNEVSALAEKAGYVQTPALYDQLIGDEYYLAGRPETAKAELGLPPQAPAPGPDAIEWSYVRDNANSRMVADLMRRYPASPLTDAWRERYAALQHEEARIAPPALAPAPAPRPAPADPRDLFRMRSGLDLPSLRDFDEFRQTDLSACMTRCAGEARCVAFTFNTAKGVCFLKDEITRLLPFRDAVSGVKRGSAGEAEFDALGVESAAAPIRNILDNVDLENYGDQDADYEINWNANFRGCKSSCERDRRCRAFTFNIARRACILKSAFRQRARFSGAISGVKD